VHGRTCLEKSLTTQNESIDLSGFKGESTPLNFGLKTAGILPSSSKNRSNGTWDDRNMNRLIWPCNYFFYLATVFTEHSTNAPGMAAIPVTEFRRILRHFERELSFQNQSGCCCGVTLTQCHALMELVLKDNITMNELAKRLYLDKSTVSRTIDNLVQANLVNREIPSANRRTTRIKLTENGRKVCKTINEGNDQYYKNVLAAIPPEKLGDFLQSLKN